MNNEPAIVPLTAVAGLQFYIAGGEREGDDKTPVVSSAEVKKDEGPVRGGVNDPAMGTTSYDVICETCYSTRRDCTGHRGTIMLKSPVVAPLFSRITERWLRIMCHECGAIMLPPQSRPVFDTPGASRGAGAGGGAGRVKTLTRLTAVSAKLHARHKEACWSCGASNAWLIKQAETDNVTTLRVPAGDARAAPEEMPPALILQVLRKLSNEDAGYMGLTANTHPSRMVLNEMPVLPVPMRPEVRKDGGRTDHDDLTVLLQMLLSYNDAVVEEEALAPSPGQREIQRALATAVFNIVRDEPERMQSRRARPGEKGKLRITSPRGGDLKSIKGRLTGKPGLIRLKLMARRSDYQARGVIANDPTVPTTHIKIPMKMAQTLQMREIVSTHNRQWLAELLHNGREQYPGLSSVRKRNGARYWVQSVPPEFVLENGDEVLRDLIDGDVVMFNRMPSLEWSAGTQYRVIVDTLNIDSSVIKMNVHICVLHNADFDGDQMNIWVAMSAASRAEITIISGAENMFIGYRYVKPRMGLTYDDVVGSQRLCMVPAMSRWMAMAMSRSVPVPPMLPARTAAAASASDFPRGRQTLSGRELVSALLIQTPVNLVMKTKLADDKFAPFLDIDEADRKTVIRNGRMLSGVLDKKVCGQGARGGLFHVISNRHGPAAALDKVFGIMQLSIGFLSTTGYTMSLGDLFVPRPAQRRLHEIADGVRAELGALQDQLVAGKLVPPIGKTTSEFFEEQALALMNVHDSVLATVLATVDSARNQLFGLVSSGAKGSADNFVATLGMSGAATVNSAMPEMSFSYKRLFPWTQRCDYGIGRAFIANSIMNGLNFEELWLASMEARFGFIGKALLTSVAGEQYRNTAKNSEAVKLDHFVRVMLSERRVLRFLYGNTGYDPRELVEVRMAEFHCSDADFEALLKTPHADHEKEAQKELRHARQRLREIRAAVRAEGMAAELSSHDAPMSDKVFLPVNVKHLLVGAIHEDGPRRKLSARDFRRMLQAVEDFCDRLPMFYTSADMDLTDLPEVLAAASSPLERHVRAACAPANLARATPAMLEHVLQQTAMAVHRAIAPAGLMVGTIAAEVFGEPFTQYMLNSLHRNAAGGTSRDAAKEMTALLSAAVEFGRAMYVVPRAGVPATTVANHIELTRLERFVTGWQVFAENFPQVKVQRRGAADVVGGGRDNPEGIRHPAYVCEADFVRRFVRLNPMRPPPSDLLPTCLRLELNRVTMRIRNTTIEEVVDVIHENFPYIYLVYSSESSPPDNPAHAHSLIVRAYVRQKMYPSRFPTEEDYGKIVQKMLKLAVHGIARVDHTSVFQLSRSYVGDDGAVAARTEAVVRTSGSSLLEVLQHPDVDPLETISTSVWDVYNVFGSQAARLATEHAIQNASGGGFYHGHVSVYADLINSAGMPMTMLDGIRKRDGNSVLLAASHRAALKNFTTAAANGTVDMLSDPAACSMLGQTPRVGTNFTRVVVDHAAVAKKTPPAGDVVDMANAVLGGVEYRKFGEPEFTGH